MLQAKIYKWALCASLMTTFFVGASDQELLKTKDINKIMQQIFDQHVDKKAMSDKIMKNALKVYIDQFDPERAYLLESDVQPYLQINQNDISQMMAQYKNGQFSEYLKLNDVIQRSILRARIIRQQLERDPSQLVLSSQSLNSDGLEEWGDPDLKKPFPKDEKQLSEKIKKGLIQFLASERKRYGNPYLALHAAQMLDYYNKQAIVHENQYLYLSENGQPMDTEHKENVFALHVVKSLANSLDAHTTVLDPAEAYDMRMRLEKQIEGIGISVSKNKEGIFTISEIVDGGPAAKNKQIAIGDKLIEIDGSSIKDKSLADVMNLLRGKNGTNVTLSIVKPNTPLALNIPLTREEIQVNDDRVKYFFENVKAGIIGKLTLDSFYQGDNGVSSEEDIRSAIKELAKQGNLRGLILDMRENGGGFLSQAVKVAGLFITNGVVVISKYFNGEEHFYRDMDGKIAFDGPLIILTSKATASAAEIVAQALQDYGVALIVGDEHTYGKGTIQSQTVTENQGSTYFKVTVGKYYTVSGKTPQIQGVKADIIVPSQFVHENLGEEYLDSALTTDVIAASYEDNLEDVTPNLKPWYMKYYMPTLQHKRIEWDNMLPALKQSSAARIAQNGDYQRFLHSAPSGPNSQAVSVDLQMNEAVNIMKDILNQETKSLEMNNKNTPPPKLISKDS